MRCARSTTKGNTSPQRATSWTLAPAHAVPLPSRHLGRRVRLRGQPRRSDLCLQPLAHHPAAEDRPHPQARRRAGPRPALLKVFATFTPIIGRTDKAHAKHAALKQHASVVGGLVLFSGWTGIDISRSPLDQVLTAGDSLEAHRVTSEDVPMWTPRVVAEKAAIGGLGPVGIGSVPDELERWIREADVDRFNRGYVTTPGTFEEVDLLIPELRRRGVYPESGAEEGLTAREKV